MKKKIVSAIILATMTVTILTGCVSTETHNPNITYVSGETEGGMTWNYVDPETGVNYVIFTAGYKGGICPRYDSDGAIMVTTERGLK